MITLDSTIADLYKTPVGNDVINKVLLQLGQSQKLVDNPLVGRLKLSFIHHKAGEYQSLIEALIDLVNSEKDVPLDDDGPIEKQWWKEAVFYQIYPKSFKDSNGDGIGDLQGIISKLDYLKELGVTCLWLSPIYDSPNDDNGYDIRDYYKIAQEMGTMDDFKELLDQVHQRDMKLIMDLVVNHTSDEHIWYQKALQKEWYYQDFYHFVEGDPESVPNNWVSFFSGPAWKYEPFINKWMLHLFTKKQPDLNWDNPDVRQEIRHIVNYYGDLGVDGFRLDVINYISKKEGYPQGNEIVGKLMEFYGIENYFYGPKLHEYLHELRVKSFEKYKMFSVGETPGIGLQMGRLLTQSQRRELDTIFNFDHLETPGHVRFDDYQYDLNYLKQYYKTYMTSLTNNDWMSLFIDNHDNPRMASKVNLSSKYYDKLCMLLNGLMLTLKGSPFIYQGQELGAKNQPFEKLDDYKDVESLNKYQELVEKGVDNPLDTLCAGSRDHARICMMWDESEHYGFGSKGWLMNKEKNPEAIVSKQIKNKESVFNFTKELIALRKEFPTFVYGDIKFIKDRKNTFVYQRLDEHSIFTVEMNISENYQPRLVLSSQDELIFTNTKSHRKSLSPYEFNIYKRVK